MNVGGNALLLQICWVSIQQAEREGGRGGFLDQNKEVSGDVGWKLGSCLLMKVSVVREKSFIRQCDAPRASDNSAGSRCSCAVMWMLV